MLGHFQSKGNYLNKLEIGPFLHIFILPTQEPLGLGHFEPLDLYFNKLGKAPLGNAIYQISST